MGSTSMTLPKNVTPRQQIEADLTWSGRVVVASNVARAYGEWANVHYAAVKETTGDDAGRVFAAITLFSGSSVLTYKDMTETMGGIAEGVSRKVLDALTPTDNESALAWRKEARDHLAKRAAQVKAEPGDTIVFERPITFTDGTTEDTFTLEVYSTRTSLSGRTRREFALRRPGTVHNKGTRSEFTEPGTFVKVPRWQDREHIVIKAAELAEQDKAAA